MKKLILSSFIAVLAVSFSFAQWTTPSGTVVATTDNVGIGTNTPNVLGFAAASKVLTINSTTSASVAEFVAARTTDGQGVGFFSFVNSGHRLVDFSITRENAGKSGDFSIRTNNGTGGTGGGNMIQRLVVKHNGKVGIGTTNPDYLLTVKGGIHANEVKIDNAIPADYVFKPDYDLMPLSEVEQFIKENHHLPNVPSEKEMLEKGIHLGEMSMKLLEKVEELTLHLIELKKENEELKQRIEDLENN